MSQASLNAAHELRRRKIWRSAISRAYYAAFSAVTAEMRKRTNDFPSGYEHPPHHRMGGYIKKYFTQLRKEDRNELRAAMRRLYKARVDADYRRDSEFFSDVLRKAFFDAEYVMKSLDLA